MIVYALEQGWKYCIILILKEEKHRQLRKFVILWKKVKETGILIDKPKPKLHSMCCALFLKIALSAVKLMSFGLLAAAIWQRCTIVCGGAVKDKCYTDKPEAINALKDNIREGLVKYGGTQSIMCLKIIPIM